MKVCFKYDEYNKRKFYRDVDIIDELPEIGDIFDEIVDRRREIVSIYPIQPDMDNNDEVFEYVYFELELKHFVDGEAEDGVEYKTVALKLIFDGEEEMKE